MERLVFELHSPAGGCITYAVRLHSFQIDRSLNAVAFEAYAANHRVGTANFPMLVNDRAAAGERHPRPFEGAINEGVRHPLSGLSRDDGEMWRYELEHSEGVQYRDDVFFPAKRYGALGARAVALAQRNEMVGILVAWIRPVEACLAEAAVS